MRRRCMRSEWQRQTVSAVVQIKSAMASHVTHTGPAISQPPVMADIQIDFDGFHRTTPTVASVVSSSNMRGDRNVPSDLASAASTGSGASGPGLCEATEIDVIKIRSGN